MRLKPRAIKRKMFTCTQCAQCISACTEVQAAHAAPSLLQWVEDECALQVSDREQGRPRTPTRNCFQGIEVQVEKPVTRPTRQPTALPKRPIDQIGIDQIGQARQASFLRDQARR